MPLTAAGRGLQHRRLGGRESEGTVGEARLPALASRAGPHSLVTGGEVLARNPGEPQGAWLPAQAFHCPPLNIQGVDWPPKDHSRPSWVTGGQAVASRADSWTCPGASGSEPPGCGGGLPKISELSLHPLGELGEKREPGLTQGCQVGRMIPFPVGKSLSWVLG